MLLGIDRGTLTGRRFVKRTGHDRIFWVDLHDDGSLTETPHDGADSWSGRWELAAEGLVLRIGGYEAILALTEPADVHRLELSGLELLHGQPHTHVWMAAVPAAETACWDAEACSAAAPARPAARALRAASHPPAAPTTGPLGGAQQGSRPGGEPRSARMPSSPPARIVPGEPVLSSAAAQLLADRELLPVDSLLQLWSAELPEPVRDLVYLPVAQGSGRDIAWAEDLINSSDWPLLPNLLPLMPIDERSIACVVLSSTPDAADIGSRLPGEGSVVRWHLDIKDAQHQAALLDIDSLAYVQSISDELSTRELGLERVFDIGEAYQRDFLAHDKRPRDFIARPVRIACQNVIVALAAFSQDASFDGLAVVAWQTCEAPHVATNEATRALLALTLCDAFKNGGTMEVRFDRPVRVSGFRQPIPGHPENAVPAAIRRYSRTLGIPIAPDARSLNPVTSRALFQAVTPMPDELRERVRYATEHAGLAPERLCYALMTGTWHPLELDFMLATSTLTASIISGGSDWQSRPQRQAESELCRSAAMSAMLFNRLNNSDSAGRQDGVRVLEDARHGVWWSVQPADGAVTFHDLPSGPLPWVRPNQDSPGGSLTVYPRTLITDTVLASVRAAAEHGPAALVVPRDAVASIPHDITMLRCPDKLADLDKAVEAKLLTSRIARA